MQWFTDDRIKHRVIGLAVLLSIGIVIFPAMIKKSNQRLDEKMNLSIQLPPKPVFPEVAATKPRALLETVKVAHVDIPDVVEDKDLVKIARAESLSGKTMATRSIIAKPPVLASSVKPQNKPTQVAVANKISRPVIKHKTKVVAQKLDGFSVQLASFALQDNAQTLVKTLHQKGFKASYDKQGSQYRVLVGPLGQLDQAKNLQKKLASATQINGFIVKIG